ncbi:MAG: response regulator [Mycetocola sp.]
MTPQTPHLSAPDGSPIRVLLVDDHELVRTGFSVILGAQPGIVVVGEARTGTEAVAQTAALSPDVICMDVQMPERDGLSATREIVAEFTSRVIILTTFDRDDYLFEALSAGASGFLLKNSAPEELIRAVRVVAAGDALLAPEATRRVLSRWGAGAPAVPTAETGPADAAAGMSSTGAMSGSTGGGTGGAEALPSRTDGETQRVLESLTAREREVLHLVADGHSNQEIADQLFLGPATIKTHVSNVLLKLGVRDRVQAVIFAHRNGIAG